MSSDELIAQLQAHLTPDLLKPAYREQNRENPLFGHCYVASEALYHLLGGRASGWYPVHARDAENIVHWWLEKASGERLDPTAGQYTSQGLTPPYPQGRRRFR